MKTLVKMEFGSHLYGTNTPQSDRDFKSVYLPEARDIVLGRANRSFQVKTKDEREKQIAVQVSKNLPSDTDIESRTLKFYLEKLAEGEPQAYDMFFAPDANLQISSFEWTEIQANAHNLIHKDTRAVLKYAKDQVKKYGTKGTRVAELRAVKDFLESKDPNSDVGDHESEIRNIIKGFLYTNVTPIEQSDGSILKHLYCCDKYLGFTTKIYRAIPPITSMFEKFGQRSLQAETNQGIDWKAVSHALRVQYEWIELLNEGTIKFPLFMGPQLIQIKQGQLSFNLVQGLLEASEQSLIKAAEKSTLPESANLEWIDDFVYGTYRQHIMKSH